jgi:hypothetical protein
MEQAKQDDAGEGSESWLASTQRRAGSEGGEGGPQGSQGRRGKPGKLTEEEGCDNNNKMKQPEAAGTPESWGRGTSGGDS